MKRIIILVAAVVSLMGCAVSITEMRQAGPLATFTSAKPEAELAKCTLFSWQNDSLAGVHYPVSLQPRPNGGETVVNDGYREIADVYTADGSTKIDFFTQHGRSSWISDRRLKSIRDCL